MALIVANPFGEIKGKLGGIVFTKNKAGQIARVYSANSKASSPAQKANRITFAQVSKAWRNLDVAEGQAWETYAQYVYSPLGKTNHGQYSGYNSFMAAQGAAINSNRWLCSCVGVMDGALGSLGFTQRPFPAFKLPDEVSVQANLHDTNLPAKALSMPVCSLSHLGVLSCRIQWIPTVLTGLAGVFFNDANALDYGFSFYMSDVMPSMKAKVKKPYKQLICSTGFMNVTTPNLNGSHYIDWLFTASPNMYDSIGYPSTGHIVQISCCVISRLGSQALVGSKLVTIT